MKRIFIYLTVTVLLFSCKEKLINKRITGTVFGTSYSVQFATYDNDLNFETQFDKLFYVINKSMSTYQTNSIISKINRNETTTIDSHFRKVFDAAKEIYKLSNGAFDPTIGVLVNAWNFGPEGNIDDLNSEKIASLMLTVGFDKVERYQDTIVKQNVNTILDFNAIAKGYGVDVIAEFLETQNIENYLVEIGGEIRAKGINMSSNKPWKIGIENPNFDGSQSIMKAISLNDEAMATSGTYRKFKVDKNGNRYAHIIDTKTGYPSKTNLLSISVIAEDCMTADAYATAFKAMGIDKVKTFLKSHPELKVFLIFENKKKELETLSLNEFPDN
ncbi:MAG: FAD:protein FMN transferase [Chlorobi bacterium]|nr:FAD:protein FMN transferase [Chlorobiota bacterium]